MRALRFSDLAGKPTAVVDMTSLTLEEFAYLVPSFEIAFQRQMREWRLDGKRRTGRRYTTYRTCPLPTAEDRLVFILVYLKTNPLQVAHGLMFGLPQGKTNQWIHLLLEVLRTALRDLGDAPARSLSELAKRLAELHIVGGEQTAEQAAPQQAADEEHEGDTTASAPLPPPLFAMMERNDASCAPRKRLNRKAVIAARKNVIV